MQMREQQGSRFERKDSLGDFDRLPVGHRKSSQTVCGHKNNDVRTFGCTVHIISSSKLSIAEDENSS